MKAFPFEKLFINSAKLSGEDGNVSLKILIEPFELSLGDYSETVETCIQLNRISIPREPSLLEGRDFCFPINPNKGYIDGSIYFFSAHNPVDVMKLKFGRVFDGRLKVELETSWVLEYENTGFSNFDIAVVAEIELLHNKCTN